MELSAKQVFLQAVPAETLAGIATQLNTVPIRMAMIYATTHMVENGATSEQLQGAKLFRNALLNIAIPAAPAPTLPVKSIKDVDEELKKLTEKK